MELKIKALFLYGLANYLMAMFALTNPTWIFDVELKPVELVSPKLGTGLGKIISFSTHGKEFKSMCVDAENSQGISICDYRNNSNIKHIETVSGCIPVTFLSKNDATHEIVIKNIRFIDNTNKKQIFEIADICSYSNQESRQLFFFFFFLINISLFFYLRQFKIKKRN